MQEELNRAFFKKEQVAVKKMLRRALSPTGRTLKSPAARGAAALTVDPEASMIDMARRARFEERLRSPQAWLEEVNDMDSQTASKVPCG
jgi:hypothetical protein